MKREPKPLKPGDRIKFEGPFLVQKKNGFSPRYAHSPELCRVHRVVSRDELVCHKGLEVIHISRRQVVSRLVPKAKKQQERVERREFWQNLYSDGLVCPIHPTLESSVAGRAANDPLFIRTVHLIEKFTGEVVLDRKKLAEVWDEFIFRRDGFGVSARTAAEDARFSRICDALGLPAEGREP